MQPVSIRPLSVLAGAGLIGLVLLAVGAVQVPGGVQQIPTCSEGPVRVAGIPDPRDMVLVKEGTPFVVPVGKILVVTALGATANSLPGHEQNDMTMHPAESPAIRSIGEKISFVHARIQELGVSIHPQSRLAVEGRIFLDEHGHLRTVLPGDSGFRTALEALRDYTLLEFILEEWPFGHGASAPTGKLRESLRDAVDPYAAAKKTQGRDTQLELFVAVALHRAGLPVELSSPDIRTTLNGCDFYVEAKRPKSMKGISGAIRKAAHQIRDSGHSGAVFVDSSLAFTPTPALVTRVMPDEEFLRLHREGLRRGIQLVDSAIADELRGQSRYLGVLSGSPTQAVRRRLEARVVLHGVPEPSDTACPCSHRPDLRAGAQPGLAAVRRGLEQAQLFCEVMYRRAVPPAPTPPRTSSRASAPR